MYRKYGDFKDYFEFFSNFRNFFLKKSLSSQQKKFNFFCKCVKFCKEKKYYSCPTFGIFKVKETLVPIFLRKKIQN